MNNRFIITDRQEQLMNGTKIIVDSVTGVQYLYVRDSYGSALTVLIDERLTQKHA